MNADEPPLRPLEDARAASTTSDDFARTTETSELEEMPEPPGATGWTAVLQVIALLICLTIGALIALSGFLSARDMGDACFVLIQLGGMGYALVWASRARRFRSLIFGSLFILLVAYISLSILWSIPRY